MFRRRVMGFNDHFGFIASAHNLVAFASVDPWGGVSLYLLLQRKMTIGQRTVVVRKRSL